MFGKRLTTLRKEKGISQYDLAKQLHLSRGQVSNYELGSREPDFEILRKIANFFDVTTDFLLGLSDVPKIKNISLNYSKLPILGTIRTGIPILANENIKGYLNVYEDTQADFVLEIVGDSMRGAAILEGDYVVCRETQVANPGQIVVALTDLSTGFSEAALKYYCDNEKGSALRVANLNYPEMIMQDGDRIAGIMEGVVRKGAPGYYAYRDNLTTYGHEEWTEVIELASRAGLKINQVKGIIEGQIEIAKRLR